MPMRADLMSQTRGDVGALRHGRRLADGTWSWGQWFRGDVGVPGYRRSDKARARREAKALVRWEREAERRIRLSYTVERGGEGHKLLPSEIQILQAIAVGERTWTPAAELVRVGLNGSTLAGLVSAGWVEEFPLTEGMALTLSAWAAEALSLDQEEQWEVHSGPIDQEDSACEKTRSCVSQPHEVPRFEVRPPPCEKGMPKPRPRAIKLPNRFHFSWLPTEVILGLLPRDVPSALDEAIANEERQRAADRERYLEREVRTEDGRLDVDPESGRVRMEPVTFGAPPADDGLKGGLNDIHGGKIPLDARMGKARKAGKKKRRRRRSA
jgi:hypothetical protein